MSSSTSLPTRIENSAKILEKFCPDAKSVLTKALTDLGVDDSEAGLALLDEKFITFDMFHSAFAARQGAEQLVLDIVPIPRLKMVWFILKDENKKEINNSPASSSLETLVKTIKPIQQWSSEELLNEYSRDGQICIHEELSRRSKNRYIILFNKDGSLDVENSLMMLKKAQFQETPQAYVLKTGEFKEVYRVGEFPLQLLYECPIHKNVLLLDDYCEECAKHWNLEEEERNIFLRLIVESKEQNLDMRNYRDKDIASLKECFPKVYLEYLSLQEENKLPSLKRKLSKPRQGDPFRVTSHKTY